jgi:hypothetical protein
MSLCNYQEPHIPINSFNHQTSNVSNSKKKKKKKKKRVPMSTHMAGEGGNISKIQACSAIYGYCGAVKGI